MYVLDTNVVSALRLPERNPAPAAWARTVPVRDQYVTAFTIAEIERGVNHRGTTDPGQAAVLRRWLLDRVLPGFADRVLAFDLAAARVFARYPVPDAAPVDDAQIAAVAEANGMIVATRNTKHFEPLGMRTINPWDWHDEET